MSRYIGKRVSYPCSRCGGQFTLSKKSMELPNGDVICPNGYINKRKGFNTFGEMVNVLWEINKQAKKMNWSGEYTIRLPLKGKKPIYKKTLNNL